MWAERAPGQDRWLLGSSRAPSARRRGCGGVLKRGTSHGRRWLNVRGEHRGRLRRDGAVEPLVGWIRGDKAVGDVSSQRFVRCLSRCRRLGNGA
jgi:hypothetical protein